MTLAQQIDQLKQQMPAMIPVEVMQLFQRSTEALVATGIAKKALAVRE